MIHNSFKTCDLCGEIYDLLEVPGSLEITASDWMANCFDLCDKCGLAILKYLKDKNPNNNIVEKK